LPKDDYERAKESIENLSDTPRPAGCKKLTGRDGWRICAGDYRVIYEIDDTAQKVTILHVGHRRDVYK
jgi:mRNA interferase RelE/StbE